MGEHSEQHHVAAALTAAVSFNLCSASKKCCNKISQLTSGQRLTFILLNKKNESAEAICTGHIVDHLDGSIQLSIYVWGGYNAREVKQI